MHNAHEHRHHEPVAAIDQLVGELERIIATLVELCAGIEAIERSWTEVDVELIVLLRESNAPEAHDTLASAGQVEPDLVAARTRISAAIGLVRTYCARLTGLSPPQTPHRPAPPPAAVHRDGSRYPPQAKWALDDLPNRVRTGTGDRTVGRILLDGRDVGALTSGLDDVWSPAVAQRMRDLGIRSSCGSTPTSK